MDFLLEDFMRRESLQQATYIDVVSDTEVDYFEGYDDDHNRGGNGKS